MKSKYFIFSFVLLGLLMVLPAVSWATDYTLLEPLPLGPSGELVHNVNTSTYLSEIYRLIIMLAGAIAVFRLIQGGVTYMSSDAFSKKSEGKQIIQETLGGLALVLGSWIIVATIMPENVKDGAFNFSLNIPSQKLPENNNPPSTTDTGGASGGLQQTTLNAIAGLKQECNCSVRITSTTGDSHDPKSLHYQGLAIDIGINSDLTKYLTGTTAIPQACSTYNKTLDGVSARFLWEPKGSKCGGEVASTADHWHMSVSK